MFAAEESGNTQLQAHFNSRSSHLKRKIMMQRFMAVSISLSAISGCAGLASQRTMSTNSPSEPVYADMATLHRIESGFQVIDPSGSQIPLKDLQSGQQVRLVTSASTPEEMQNGSGLVTAEYVGTIDVIDDNNIVLKNASLLTNARVQRATPVVSRVPYFSRLFKTTSIARDMQPLPHGVTVPRSKIIVALRPEPTEVVERIGVDFDFNVDAAGQVLKEDTAVVAQ